MQSMLSAAEQELDLDDGQFIDMALDAMVASLEEPHAHSIPRGTFTIAGWEIDRQLDNMITSIQEEDETQVLDGKAAEQQGTATSVEYRFSYGVTGDIPSLAELSPSHAAPVSAAGHARGSRDGGHSLHAAGGSAGLAIQGSVVSRINRERVRSGRSQVATPGSSGGPWESNPVKDGAMIDRLVDDLVGYVDQTRELAVGAAQ
mmetsp:Transcript_13794/g.29765  ORF Transcript_13794/g.29765 Transcript_13794/m.29765 type:complete len:203 (-) Transcript_13794:820-1428(-)